MTLRAGTYIVPTHRWYIERTVWLIAGGVLLTSTALAALVNPLWVLVVIATGISSITVALTGFCLVGNVLKRFGFTPMLGRTSPTPGGLYFLQTDRWYLERRIYLAVGINISVASILVTGAQPVVAAVHRLRRFSDGMVRGDRLLYHGQRIVLARSRATPESGGAEYLPHRPQRWPGRGGVKLRGAHRGTVRASLPLN